MDFGEDKIARLVRTNKRLTRELSRIESIFNAINEAVIICSNTGAIKYANIPARNILALPNESLHTQNLSKILPAIDTIDLRLALDGSTFRKEFEINYPERKFIRAYISAYSDEESELDVAIIISDITQEKISTQEKIESEKIASVLKLASGVAHELGNPLNSIGIHLQLANRAIKKIADCPEKSKLENFTKICSEEVSRLDGIIKNFLKALRPARPNLSEINPLEPLLKTMSFLENEIGDLKINIEIKSPKSLPTMLGDSDLLKQLYFNLVKNSMEAMDAGGTISIETSFDDNSVKIAISDTGCGIDHDEITRIFEPYFTTKTDGNGLGMMICYEIVKSHGGTISVSSKKGEGTCISISFPRKDKRIREIESPKS